MSETDDVLRVILPHDCEESDIFKHDPICRMLYDKLVKAGKIEVYQA